MFRFKPGGLHAVSLHGPTRYYRHCCDFYSQINTSFCQWSEARRGTCAMTSDDAGGSPAAQQSDENHRQHH